MWGKLYQEAARGALAKLENVLPAEQRQEIAWAQHSLVAIGMNRADIEKLAPFLDKLRRAVRENCRISMTYQNSNSPRCEQREVNPYVLVHRSGWWYMIGFCQMRQDIRTFRVDRIAELNLTDQTFSLPADFDIHAYIAQEWQYIPQITVRMCFAPQFTHLAKYGRGYWGTHEEQPDGSVIVTFNAPDVYAAASNALAYGPGVTVLEPLEVCQMVQEWAREVTNLY
jgi:predicted DNA-binding transcriptional regulator YafY